MYVSMRSGNEADGWGKHKSLQKCMLESQQEKVKERRTGLTIGFAMWIQYIRCRLGGERRIDDVRRDLDPYYQAPTPCGGAVG